MYTYFNFLMHRVKCQKQSIIIRQQLFYNTNHNAKYINL